MLETSDYPTVSRVMRVQPSADEKPADGFSWGDYEDVRPGDDADREDDGGGWGVIKSKSELPILYYPDPSILKHISLQNQTTKPVPLPPLRTFPQTLVQATPRRRAKTQPNETHRRLPKPKLRLIDWRGSRNTNANWSAQKSRNNMPLKAKITRLAVV
jgi:hypothetical protein